MKKWYLVDETKCDTFITPAEGTRKQDVKNELEAAWNHLTIGEQIKRVSFFAIKTDINPETGDADIYPLERRPMITIK